MFTKNMVLDKDMDYSILNVSGNATAKHDEGFSLVNTKIVGLVAMALSTIIFALLPLIFVKKLRNNDDPSSKRRFTNFY